MTVLIVSYPERLPSGNGAEEDSARGTAGDTARDTARDTERCLLIVAGIQTLQIDSLTGRLSDSLLAESAARLMRMARRQ